MHSTNGAGKTVCSASTTPLLCFTHLSSVCFQTTLDILCGYQEMTSGEATVGGFDVKTQLDSVYKVLGVCPQFDCIWPDLTVQGM